MEKVLLIVPLGIFNKLKTKTGLCVLIFVMVIFT